MCLMEIAHFHWLFGSMAADERNAGDVRNCAVGKQVLNGEQNFWARLSGFALATELAWRRTCVLSKNVREILA